MSTTEFSTEFDVLYNNIMSNQAPGLDEYEKSVFLTKAQDEIIEAYFNPTQNKSLLGFDSTEKRQIEFLNLIKTVKLEEVKADTTAFGENPFHPSSSTYCCFNIPDDILVILNEKIVGDPWILSNDTKQIIVKPISYLEYNIKASKPFGLPPKRQAWRLITGSQNSPKIVEIIFLHDANNTFYYLLRYVKKPNPIVLINLTNDYSGLSINGVTTKTECELDSIIHQDILQRAVELAKATYEENLTSQLALANYSQTEVGTHISSKDT